MKRTVLIFCAILLCTFSLASLTSCKKDITLSLDGTVWQTTTPFEAKYTFGATEFTAVIKEGGKEETMTCTYTYSYPNILYTDDEGDYITGKVLSQDKIQVGGPGEEIILYRVK